MDLLPESPWVSVMHAHAVAMLPDFVLFASIMSGVLASRRAGALGVSDFCVLFRRCTCAACGAHVAGCDVLRHTSSTIHLSRISVVRSSSRCTHAQPHLHSLGASRSMLCHVSAVRPAVCCAASSSSSSSNTSRRHLRHTPVQSMSGVAAPYVLSAAAAGQSEGGSPVASSEQQQHQHQQRTVQQEHAHLTHLVVSIAVQLAM